MNLLQVRRKMYDMTGVVLPSGTRVQVKRAANGETVRLYDVNGSLVDQRGNTMTGANGIITFYAEADTYVFYAYNRTGNLIGQVTGVQPGERIDIEELAAQVALLINVPVVETPDPRQGVINLRSDAAEGTLETLTATLLPVVEADSAAGRGRVIQLPSDVVTSGVMSISTTNSIRGAGVVTSTVRLNTASMLAGSYSHLSVLDDSQSFYGMRPQSEVSNVTFDGNRRQAPADVLVDGYVITDRNEGRGHIINNAEFVNYSRHGVVIGKGGDQLITDRLRAEGNAGWGIIIGSDGGSASDGKHTRMGSGGNELGALKIIKSAPTIDQGDLWLPNGAAFKGECTLEIVDATRVTMRTMTVSGRTIVRGRNDQGTGVRNENAQIVLDNMNFKHDATLNAGTKYADGTYVYDSYITAEDVDGLRLVNPKFGHDITLAKSSLPAYGIKHTTVAGQSVREGRVYISGGSGIIERIDNDTLIAHVGFKTHYSDNPELVIWEGFVPGEPEFILLNDLRYTSNTERTYLRFDGTTAWPVTRYPLAYLWWTLAQGTPGRLDDGVTTFTLPALTSPFSQYVMCLRTTP